MTTIVSQPMTTTTRRCEIVASVTTTEAERTNTLPESAPFAPCLECACMGTCCKATHCDGCGDHNQKVNPGAYATVAIELPVKCFTIPGGVAFYCDPFCNLDCNENTCCKDCFDTTISFNKPLPVASRPTPIAGRKSSEVYGSLFSSQPETRFPGAPYAELCKLRADACCPEFAHCCPTDEEMRLAYDEEQEANYEYGMHREMEGGDF